MLVPVYDIVNCGPRKRFAANGKLVHNSDKVNLQNLPRTSPLRSALLAPADHAFVICDLSQIEARMVAWLAGQDDLRDAFAEGRDVYSEFASDVYGRAITKADKMERFVGKVCILSLQYGVGHKKFRMMLANGGVHIDENEAQTIVQMYRRKYFRIPMLWRYCNAALNGIVDGDEGSIGDTLLTYDATGIQLPSGFNLQYAGLDRTEDGFAYAGNARSYKKLLSGDASGRDTRLYGAAVLENASQALARLVMTEHMLRINKAYRIVLQVHDEVIALAPVQEVQQAREYIERVMSTPPAWAPGLPVACEAGVGSSYGAGH
jgi:DNA polymerase I-like protein with 3'-5' exonuclease and polymerase domains